MKKYKFPLLPGLLLSCLFIACSDDNKEDLPDLQPGEGMNYSPKTPDADQPLTITFKAPTSSALFGYKGEVYIHTGVVGEGDWQYVPAEWNQNIDKCKMTKLEENIWSITLEPDIRQWFQSGKTPIEKLGIVIRSSDGSKKGIDIDSFVEVTDHKYQVFSPAEIKHAALPGNVEEGINVINNTTPIWTKKPSDLKDEDYKEFYRELYPMSDEPLFWIHLNVDYPFNLTGVLYFPKIKNNIELQRNKIQLYCNQVYVTDSVEGIVPDFLTLLHGVIDSPDIPLNVSRSYLQSDSNVKKISSYITKKVSDRLQSLFKNDRKEFEQKWDDIKIFINYGMLTQDDFYDKAKNFALFKDCDGKYFTFEEYQQLIKDNQTDKDGNLIYLYAQNKEAQYSYIEAAKNKGYSVLLLDGQLDTPVISMLERKFEKSRFTRVDADAIDRLIVKDSDNKSAVDAETSAKLSSICLLYTSPSPRD